MGKTKIQSTSPSIEEGDIQDLNLAELAERQDWREVLRKIVEKEGMNPWDIDVSQLVREYIEVIKEMEMLSFRVPANAVLASSILLRKKSSSWVLKEDEEDDFSIWEELPMTPDQIPPAREDIPEPKPQRRKTQRKVSVDELIDAVEDVIDKEKKKAREKAKESTQQNILPSQLLEMAKENTEDFEEKTEEIEEKIRGKIDSENLTMFSDITEEDEDVREVVNTLIPLLHLANKDIVSIWQEEVFGEIFIHYIGEN